MLELHHESSAVRCDQRSIQSVRVRGFPRASSQLTARGKRLVNGNIPREEGAAKANQRRKKGQKLTRVTHIEIEGLEWF